MRTVVTGGAGFIGSHLVPQRLEAGDEVVVLDSLEPQVHTGGESPLPDDVELVVGNVADADLVDGVLADADRVVHLAAVVGVGQSMYEIDRYVRMNTMATATFRQRVAAHRDNLQRLVVASSMSIYGEGEYVCDEHGSVVVSPRPEEQLVSRQWECRCPHCGAQLRPVPHYRGQAAHPHVRLRDQQARPRAVCLSSRGLRRAAVALRFFNVTGPARRCRTRTPASQRSSPRAC